MHISGYYVELKVKQLALYSDDVIADLKREMESAMNSYFVTLPTYLYTHAHTPAILDEVIGPTIFHRAGELQIHSRGSVK